MEVVDYVSRFRSRQLAVRISLERVKVSVRSGRSSEGRAEHDHLEECALMRGEYNIVGEVNLLAFGPSLLLLLSQTDTIHLWEAKPTAVVGQKRDTLLIRITNHAVPSLTHLQPVLPGGNQLHGPQVPITDPDFETVSFTDVRAVLDGGGEGFFELLLAFDVPASEQTCVVKVLGGCGFQMRGGKGAAGDNETPGQGRSVAEAGCDSLAAKWREDMRCVSAENHALQGPLVAATGREGERPGADDFDAVVGVLDAVGQAGFFW